jgi:hypothetical protein
MKILAQSLCGLLLSMPAAAQNHMPTQSHVVGLFPALATCTTLYPRIS